MISRDIEGNEYDVTAADLAWRPSAYGIVIHESRILLVTVHGRFHLPGGGIDLGENPAEAVLREVREETGCTVKNPKLLDITSSFFSYGAFDNPPKVQHVHSLLIYYTCDYVSHDPSDIHLDKYEEAYGQKPEWVDLAKLDDIIVGTTVDWRPIVKHLPANQIM